MLDLLELVRGPEFSTRHKGAMIEISHAIEDVAASAGAGTRLYSAFQLASIYRPERQRYSSLISRGVSPTAWYLPDESIVAEHPVVVLQREDPWCAGWWVVVSGPEVKIGLVAEDIDGLAAPQSRRRFRGTLGFDSDVIDALERRLCEAAGQSLPVDPAPTQAQLRQRNVLVGHVANRLADYLDRARSREREESHLKELLAGTIIHDLRNPLQLVIGWTALLQSGRYGPVPTRWQDPLTAIDDAGHHIDRLIGTILDAFKLESGAMKLARRRIQIEELLERVRAGALYPGAPPIGIDQGQDLPALWIDPELVERALHNLVGNAIKYGGDTGIILSARAEPPAHIVIGVADHGPGLPDDKLASIFDRFAQLDDSGSRRGSGLGLYFCRLVAELHGGSISASNRLGGGALFNLALPAVSDGRRG